MSETFQRGFRGATPSYFDPQRSGQGAVGWAGWVVFGGLMMLLLAVLHIIAGFVAFFKDDYYHVDSHGLLVPMNWTAYGWIHILFGLFLGAAGVALLLGHLWGRIVTVIVALLTILLNFALLSAAPIWSVICITLTTLTVYAIVVHGREVRDVD